MSTTENETARYDQPEPVELTDRELLENIANDISVIKNLMGSAIESLGPIMGDAKVKLILGALKGMFR